LLLLTGLTLVFVGYNSQIIAYILPLALKEWNLTPVKAGSMVSYGFFGLMFGAIAFGMASDRIGRKKILMLAVATFSVFNGIAFFAPDFLIFCILRFLCGLGLGGAITLTITLLSEFAPARIRAKILTAAVGGFTFGWVISALVAMALIPSFGWRIVLLIGFLPVFFIPVLKAYLPESVRFLAGKKHYKEAIAEIKRVERIAGFQEAHWTSDNLSQSSPQTQGRFRDLFSSGLTLMTILLWLTYLFNMIALYGLATWLPQLLVKAGFSLVKSYSYAMVQAIGAVVGGFLLGCLMDAFGRKPGLSLTYLLGGFSVLLFGTVSSNIALYIAGAAIGVFIVSAPNALHVVCSETYPTHIRSTGIGWAHASGRVGSILGPILGGILQMADLSFRQFFTIFAIPCFICVVLILLYRVNVRGDTLETISIKLKSSEQ
jgi:AAHS family benzoate transporter-like MFS transporter